MSNALFSRHGLSGTPFTRSWTSGESQQAGSVTEFVTDSSTTLHRGAAESASVRLSHVALLAVACFTGDHHFKPGHDVGEVSPEPMVHEEAH